MNPLAKTLFLAVAFAIVGWALLRLIDANLGDPVAAVLDIAILTTLIFVAARLSSTAGAGGTTTQSSASATNSDHETGSVKWFNVKKGYGFITRDAGDDVFVHYRNIEGEGRRSISEGQRVSFVVVNGEKGLQAEEVSAI